MIIKGNHPEPNTITYTKPGFKQFHNDKYVFIPILKNAYRYTATLLEDYGFTKNFDGDFTNKTKIIVLRDPVKRWFIGAANMLYPHFPNMTVTEETVDLLTRIVVLDKHTRAQSNYLAGIDTDDCIFFNVEFDTFTYDLDVFCHRTFGGKVDMSKTNPNLYHTVHPNYTRIQNLLKEFCTTAFVERLKSYYHEDYKLLDTVKFYRG